VSFSHSPTAPARFGFSVARMNVGWDADDRTAAAYVWGHLISADEHLVIARWPTQKAAIVQTAAESTRKTFAADVLVYWEARPDEVLAALPAGDDLRVVVTSGADLAPGESHVVDDIVRDSFHRYGNHYLANPEIDPAAALDGYVEWASRTLADRAEDVLVLREGGRSAGLATVVASGRHDLEVELAGIRREFQGRGLYFPLLRACAEAARERGCRRLLISTQVHNVRVQRLWARGGMVPFAALTTVHALRR